MSKSSLEQHRGKLMTEGPDFSRRKIKSHSIALIQEDENRVGVEIRQYLLDDGSFWESHIEHNEASIMCEWHQIVPPVPRVVVPEEAEIISKLRQQINHLVEERDALRKQGEQLVPWRVIATAKEVCQAKASANTVSGYGIAWKSIAAELGDLMVEYGVSLTQPYELKK